MIAAMGPSAEPRPSSSTRMRDANKIVAILLHDLVKSRRIAGFKQHKSAVVGQRFHGPLVAVAAPANQVAPPLVRGLVRDNLLLKQACGFIAFETLTFRRAQERITGEENEAGPALAHRPGELS